MMARYNAKIFIPAYFAGKTVVIDYLASDDDDALVQACFSMRDFVVEVKKK